MRAPQNALEQHPLSAQPGPLLRPAHNTIVVSRVFMVPSVPRYAVDILSNHEMLHCGSGKSARQQEAVPPVAISGEEEKTVFPTGEAKEFLKRLGRPGLYCSSLRVGFMALPRQGAQFHNSPAQRAPPWRFLGAVHPWVRRSPRHMEHLKPRNSFGGRAIQQMQAALVIQNRSMPGLYGIIPALSLFRFAPNFQPCRLPF